jgi:nucleoid-associated protein YgaU
MTSDAKIGLLLGLVFIFVIAFIINGLPNFGSRAQNADATPAMTFPGENLGLADQAQNAQELLDWTTVLEQDDTERAMAGEEPPPAATRDQISLEAQPAVTRDSGEVRSEYSLDFLVDGARRIGDVVKELSEASEAVTMQQQTSEPTPAFDLSPLRPVEAAPGAARASAPVNRPANASARGPARRTYEVQKGDVLATVAKKAYGPVEGNRLVNVRRIYEANRAILKSPDEIFVGQKLVIPPLPDTAERPNATLSEAVFERVEAVGRRNLADIREPTPEGRWYVVKDGDNLWKIAASQLGSGARCDEIAKLNASMLKNKDMLDIGMRLQLPSR